MRRGAAIGGGRLRRPARSCWMAVALASCVAPLAAHPASAAPTTKRVSVGPDGIEAVGGGSIRPSISGDGRYVAFDSRATNLVPADTNGLSDVFVADLFLGTTTRISVGPAGEQATDNSYTPSISDDGDRIAYHSYARDINTLDSPHGDIFRLTRSTGSTGIVSAPHRERANGDSLAPAISGNGEFVAFESFASNINSGDDNGQKDVFRHPGPSGFKFQAMRFGTSNARFAAGASARPAISDDGSIVAFQSTAPDIVHNDTNGRTDIFVRINGTTVEAGSNARVSTRSGGVQATGGDSFNPAVSGDGRFVAFQSSANDLVSGDTNGVPDVFVHDRATSSTSRVSVADAGAQATGGGSFLPSITDDGRFVAFQSRATNLVPGDTNGLSDVFVHDRSTGTTTRVSVNDAGDEATGGGSFVPAISDDGRFVAFDSAATNLVAGDTNGMKDVFVRDRGVGAGFSGAWKRARLRCPAATPARCRFDARLAIANPGLLTAAASRARVYLSRDRSIGRGDRLVKRIAVARLRPGQVKAVTVRGTFSRAVSGRHLIARLDATDRVDEVDEKNNVVVSPPLRPRRR